jgi:hypothetical protein
MEKMYLRRPITEQERKTALKFYWLIIPLALIATLISWVLLKFDSLPLPVRIAGAVIISGAVLVFISKWIKLYRDLQEGYIIEIKGNLDRKVKFGGHHPNTNSSGTGRMARKNRSSATYILEVDGARYNVKAKVYSKVKQEESVQLNYLEKSDYVLDAFPIKTE